MNRLREFREDRGMAQQAVAVVAGVSPAILVAIEKYDYKPTPAVQGRIAAAVGRTPIDIWPESETHASRAAVQT